MDADVAQLVREERLLEAARLASDRGDAPTASALYERACEWQRASEEAMRAGDPARALELAIYGADDPTADRVLPLLLAQPRAAEALAERLARRGQDAWAARLLESCGRDSQAARAWERAGDAIQAAKLLERAGEPADAARVLESALRRDARAWPVAVELAALLGRFGKWEASVRTLQRVPADAAERRDALVGLVHALEELGLTQAAQNAATELESLGQAPAARADVVPGVDHAAAGAADVVPGVDHAAAGAADVPSHAHAQAQARLFGRYEVVREVASSPSARVLECVDVVGGDRVAIKMFAAWGTRGSGRDALARFEREVRAMRAVDHSGVVPLLDFLPDEPAIVLAWMGGGTLERMLSASGPLAPARAVEIASAVLSALGAAHRLGILHRDVKPANVLFDDAGGVRLSDFGVAHLDDVSTTATAGVFGTIAYMSPEQREGRPATAQSDVFAVGAMLREMLTGERPSTEDASRLLPSEAHHGLDARHDAAVARLTAVDPRDRPADPFDASALLATLPWPQGVDATGLRAPAKRAGPVPGAAAERLERRTDGTRVDLWTGRTVECTPLTARTLPRARAFALAGHPALQAVWRVDETAGAIWLQSMEGTALDRRLTPDERERLEGGLDALHAAGAVHGRVDAEHVVVTRWGVVLRFEGDHDPTATVDRDRTALGRL